MARRSFRNKTVVVTGAARGLGKALCRRFARAGARVGGIDLLESELAATGDELRGEGYAAATAVCDLTSEEATFGAFRQLRQELGAVDVLVANAGITHIRNFDAGESAAVRRVMEVNFQGAVHAAAAAFDDVVARRGMFVAISSVAGFAPLVGRTGYAASKHALHGFFDTLRAELRGRGVDVLVVTPSYIATAIRKHVGDGREPGADARTVGDEASPDAVAEEILVAAERCRRRLATGRVGQAAYWLQRLAPRLYEQLMLRNLR